MLRIPARSFDEMKLSDDSYGPDFALTDRYQTFSSELLRLSLLGIAGYGFIISEVVMSSPSTGKFMERLRNHPVLLAAGITALAIAAATAAAHRYFSTNCLAYQVSILRLLRRTESSEWSEDERLQTSELLEQERASQRRTLARAQRMISVSSILLVCGIVITATAFGTVLLGAN